MKVIRLSERRRQAQKRAEALDAALDFSLEDSLGPFDGELWAARQLIEAHQYVTAPPEALVAMRAGLAARRSAPASPSRRRWAVQAVPGAVAAAAVGLVLFMGFHPFGSGTQAGAQQASQILHEINARMATVTQAARSNDRSGVLQAAQSVRQTLVAAQQAAAPLPPDNVYRDVLLQTAEAKIAQLEALLAQLQLPPVPRLPPIEGSPSSGSSPQALAGPATTLAPRQRGGTTTTTSSSTTTSSTTSTTAMGSTSTATSAPPNSGTTTIGANAGATSASQGSGTDTRSGGQAGTTQSGSSGSTTATSTTTTSTTTTSTTPVPPPPSTTTTTSPPSPNG